MFEPDTSTKMEMITRNVISNGTCIHLGGPTSETKFRADGTEVRFMRDGERFTNIAIENEDRNIYVYWTEGFDAQFMLTEDGHEFNQMFSELINELGIMF